VTKKTAVLPVHVQNVVNNLKERLSGWMNTGMRVLNSVL
jgi:hypothetical protein